MSAEIDDFIRDEFDDGALCACGHEAYLHDDGRDACVENDCQCLTFDPEVKS